MADVDIDLYDEIEVHHGCTVEVWRNSVTGKVSVGWYEDDGEDGDDEGK